MDGVCDSSAIVIGGVKVQTITPTDNANEYLGNLKE